VCVCVRERERMCGVCIVYCIARECMCSACVCVCVRERESVCVVCVLQGVCADLLSPLFLVSQRACVCV